MSNYPDDEIPEDGEVFRDFDEDERTEPIRFKLEGIVFEAFPEAPDYVLVDFADSAEGTTREQAEAGAEFIRAVLIDEKNVEAFDELRARRPPEKPLSFRKLINLGEWLSEQYLHGLPLGDSDNSSRGDGRTGSRGRATSRSGGSRAQRRSAARRR